MCVVMGIGHAAGTVQGNICKVVANIRFAFVIFAFAIHFEVDIDVDERDDSYAGRCGNWPIVVHP